MSKNNYKVVTGNATEICEVLSADTSYKFNCEVVSDTEISVDANDEKYYGLMKKSQRIAREADLQCTLDARDLA